MTLFFPFTGRYNKLTCLLSENDWFALAAFRDGGHTDVIVDARFQSVHRVITSGGIDHVFKNRDALTRSSHHDLVTCDNWGAER